MTLRNTAFHAVTTLIFGLLSTACTVEHLPDNSSNFVPSNLSFDSMFSSAQLKCDDPNNCPGNVGLIVFKSIDEDGNRGFGQCTGTLVGEDLVLTASHCLPDTVKSRQVDCGTEVGFVRSASDRYPQKIRCSEIVHFSVDFNSTLIDYALFRLKEKATDNPTRISRSGVPDNSSVYSYSIDPSSRTSIQGLMKKKTCQTVMGAIVAPEYVHPLSKIIGLRGDNCKLIGGNSGSGMMMGEEIRGVISRGRKTADVKQMFKGKDTPMGGAVNLACRELPRAFPMPGADCRTSPSESIFDTLKTSSGVARTAWPALRQVVSRAPIFRFRIEFTSRTENKDEANNLMRVGQAEYLRLGFKLTPACVVPRAHWSALGIQTQISDNGAQVIVASLPTDGDLSILLVADDQTRLSPQSRTLNVSERIRVLPANTLANLIPWCTEDELAQQFLP